MVVVVFFVWGVPPKALAASGDGGESHQSHITPVLSCEGDEEKRKQWEEESQDQNGDSSAPTWSSHLFGIRNPHVGCMTISQCSNKNSELVGMLLAVRFCCYCQAFVDLLLGMLPRSVAVLLSCFFLPLLPPLRLLLGLLLLLLLRLLLLLLLRRRRRRRRRLLVTLCFHLGSAFCFTSLPCLCLACFHCCRHSLQKDRDQQENRCLKSWMFLPTTLFAR